MVWDMWLVQYAHMDKESYISFEQFKINAKTEPAIKRSEKEILEDAEMILGTLKIK